VPGKRFLRNSERRFRHLVRERVQREAGIKRAVLVRKPDREAAAEHRLGHLNDAAVRADQKPRNRAQLAAVVAFAQNGAMPVHIGAVAGDGLDCHPLDCDRVDVEVPEFQLRRNGRIPRLQQGIARIELNVRGQEDTQ
jgi:hypothetical protein